MHIRGMSDGSFREFIDAVMGEEVKRLSREYRAEHPGIPWRLMAGMRDVLIHGYDIVNLKEVWKTINLDLPQVLPQLEALVSED